MLVSLSRHSWHSKYYNFVKGYYPTYEFKSLCPYFWTIVSFILLLPVILIWKGLKLLSKLAIKPIEKAIVYGVGKAVSELKNSTINQIIKKHVAVTPIEAKMYTKPNQAPFCLNN